MTRISDYIRYESDRLVLRLARFVWQMHIVSAVVLWFSLQGEVSEIHLSVWAAWMIVWGLIQGWTSFRGSAHARENLPLGTWSKLFDVSAIMAAAGYGWLAFALVPAGNEPLAVFIGFIISGGVLTGTGTHNMHYPMLATTLLIIVPAQAARAWMDDVGGQGAIGAGMLIAFLGLMLGLGWVLRTFTRRSFVLEWEKTQLANALAKAREEAEAANLAKSRFLAQASHDLRQPVHSMGLFLASLEREHLSDAGAMLTNRLTQSVDVLSKLFTSLLDVTLLDSGKLEPSEEPIGLKQLVEEVIREFEPAAEAERCRLLAELNEGAVLSDPILLRRVLQNLVSNAIRHGEGDVIIATNTQEDEVFISVQDCGAGVSSDDAERIFNAFERPGGISDSAEGLGLGLAIVRRIIAALGTGIELDTSAEQGARFVIGPLRATTADESPALTISEPQISETTGHALVIDDDTVTLEATGALLSNWGWDIQTCSNLEEIVLSPERPVDLIIADYDLGRGQTGIDAVNKVRETASDCPAVVISGSSTDAVRNEIEAAGLLLLLKPVRPAQLRSAILSLVGR